MRPRGPGDEDGCDNARGNVGRMRPHGRILKKGPAPRWLMHNNLINMMVLWSTLQLVLDSIKPVILDRDGFTGGCGGGGGGGALLLLFLLFNLIWKR